YYLETPGMEEGWDKLNIERSLQLSEGVLKLKPLPAEEPKVKKSKKAPAKPAAPAKKRPAQRRAVTKPAAKKKR
ncbi:MAG: hypothetical protein ACO25N_02040, partial [Candidatus Limnocylindrus sp.]